MPFGPEQTASAFGSFKCKCNFVNWIIRCQSVTVYFHSMSVLNKSRKLSLHSEMVYRSNSLLMHFVQRTERV